MRWAAALVAAAWTGCADPPPSPPPKAAWSPDLAWIRSAKLAPDVQELVFRAHDVDHAFPFRVAVDAPDGRARLEALGFSAEPAGEGKLVVRSRPADLRKLTDAPDVKTVQCETPRPGEPGGDGWRRKVDDDLRTMIAAKSGCFCEVAIRFSSEVSTDARGELEAFGLEVHAFDAKSAIGWMPVAAVALVAALPWVARVEPRPSVPGR